MGPQYTKSKAAKSGAGNGSHLDDPAVVFHPEIIDGFLERTEREASTRDCTSGLAQRASHKLLTNLTHELWPSLRFSTLRRSTQITTRKDADSQSTRHADLNRGSVETAHLSAFFSFSGDSSLSFSRNSYVSPAWKRQQWNVNKNTNVLETRSRQSTWSFL